MAKRAFRNLTGSPLNLPLPGGGSQTLAPGDVVYEVWFSRFVRTDMLTETSVDAGDVARVGLSSHSNIATPFPMEMRDPETVQAPPPGPRQIEEDDPAWYRSQGVYYCKICASTDKVWSSGAKDSLVEHLGRVHSLPVEVMGFGEAPQTTGVTTSDKIVPTPMPEEQPPQQSSVPAEEPKSKETTSDIIENDEPVEEPIREPSQEPSEEPSEESSVPTCAQCGKTFKSERGVKTHIRMKH